MINNVSYGLHLAIINQVMVAEHHVVGGCKGGEMSIYTLCVIEIPTVVALSCWGVYGTLDSYGDITPCYIRYLAIKSHCTHLQ